MKGSDSKGVTSPRGARPQNNNSTDPKKTKSKLLAWGRTNPKAKTQPPPSTNPANPNAQPQPAPMFSPRSDPPPYNGQRAPRASILLGKDSLLPTAVIPKKDDGPKPVSREERFSILAPTMASTSRRDEDKSFWKVDGNQQKWRKSVVQTKKPDTDFVPPHSVRPRGSVQRPAPPTTPPPQGTNSTTSSQPKSQWNTGGTSPNPRDKDFFPPGTLSNPSPRSAAGLNSSPSLRRSISSNTSSPKPGRAIGSLGRGREASLRKTNIQVKTPEQPIFQSRSPPEQSDYLNVPNIHGIVFDERILEDPDFGETTIDKYSGNRYDTDDQINPALERDVTFQIDFEDNPDDFGFNRGIERDVTFQLDEDPDDPYHQLTREVTFGEATFPTPTGVDPAIERDLTFTIDDFTIPDFEENAPQNEEPSPFSDVDFNDSPEVHAPRSSYHHLGLSAQAEAQAAVNAFLDLADFNFQEVTFSLDKEEPPAPSPKANPAPENNNKPRTGGFERQLTLGGLKNLAIDIDFGEPEEPEEETTSEGSYSSEDAASFHSEDEGSDDEIEVGPGTEVTLRYRLGRGATAVVWCGMVDANIVAIKQITLKNYKEGLDNAKLVVKREYDIVKSIQHRSIIKYHGLFYDKEAEEVNIVMQMINGVLVTDLVLFTESVPEDLSAFILGQVIEGFVHLHTVSNVIHRDLKPDNVLIDVNGQIKIIDFGTATLFAPSQEAKRRSTVGTPWYCAPEVINDEEYTTTADVWSLGCFALELVSGKPPFDELNDLACLFKMSQGVPPPLPKSLSDPCANFIQKCLEPDWKSRATMGKLMNHPFIASVKSNSPTIRRTLCNIIKEMVIIKKEKDKSKFKESPTQISDDRLTFNFG